MHATRSLGIATAFAAAAVASLCLAAPASSTAPASSPAEAETNPGPGIPADVAANIRKAIESRYSGAHVFDIQPTGMAGLYEVFVGDRVVYTDVGGDYLIIGSLIETRTHADLTKASMERRETIDFKSLPFDKAIKIVKGNGSRSLAVFEDPDCPYCQRLESSLKSVTNVTEYVFLFPIDELHPQATVHAHAIWCAPDRGKAWTDWLVEKKAPPAASCHGDPIPELGKLGEKLNITGTPTLFTSNGKRVSGAISGPEIEKILVASAGGTPAAGVAAPANNSASTKPTESAKP
jgi:thiol:disulfide interchange protein DsbC